MAGTRPRSSLPSGAPPQAAWNTYVRVESADDAAARVSEAGGQVLSEPFDVFDSASPILRARSSVSGSPGRVDVDEILRAPGLPPMFGF